MAGLRHRANPALVGMLQDQPCHQVGQRCLGLRRQPGPCRHATDRRPRFSCEQVDLLRRAAVRRCRLCPAWHRPIPDSGRERVYAPETGAFDDAKWSFSACRSSVASVVSAARSAWASVAIRAVAQADRSNIQTRMPRVQQFSNLSSPLDVQIAFSQLAMLAPRSSIRNTR